MNFLKRSSLAFIFCIIPTFYSAFSMQQFSLQERGEIESVADGFAGKAFDCLMRSACLPVEVVAFLDQHKDGIKDGSKELFRDRLAGLHRTQFAFLREEGSGGIREGIVQDLLDQWKQSLLDAVGAESPEFAGIISQNCFPRADEGVRTAALEQLQRFVRHPRNIDYKKFAKKICLCAQFCKSLAVAVWLPFFVWLIVSEGAYILDGEKVFQPIGIIGGSSLITYLMYIFTKKGDPSWLRQRIEAPFKEGYELLHDMNIDFKGLAYRWIPSLAWGCGSAYFGGWLFGISGCSKLLVSAATTLGCKGAQAAGISLNPLVGGRQLWGFGRRMFGY